MEINRQKDNYVVNLSYFSLKPKFVFGLSETKDEEGTISLMLSLDVQDNDVLFCRDIVLDENNIDGLFTDLSTVLALLCKYTAEDK
jgi:hypothetical protein